MRQANTLRTGEQRRRVLAWIAVLLGLSSLLGCPAQDVEQRFQRGRDMLFENRHEDAEAEFAAIARDLVNSPRPDAEALRARALVQVGRINHLYLDQPRRAVARLREAIKSAPDGPLAFDARHEIAVIFLDRLQDYRTAALEFERLVHEFHEHDGLDAYQYRVAQCYFMLREFDQARAEGRMLVEKWPSGPWTSEARLLVANAYYLEGRLEEAVEAHRQVLESDPPAAIRSRSWFELGMCLQDLGRNGEAERAFLEALKDHPRPDLVQLQLAALHERIRNEDDGAVPLSNPLEPTSIPAVDRSQPSPDGGTIPQVTEKSGAKPRRPKDKKPATTHAKPAEEPPAVVPPPTKAQPATPSVDSPAEETQPAAAEEAKPEPAPPAPADQP